MDSGPVLPSFVRIPGADGHHPTYCRLCEAQCGLIAETVGGRIVKVRPDRNHPVSQGHLCVKGPGMVSVTYDPDRVLTPLRRIGAPGEFEPVSWDDALDDIAQRLDGILLRHGIHSLGTYMGNPASFATLRYGYLKHFGDVLGGAKFFNALHVDTGAKNLGLELVYGDPIGWTFPDLDRCDFLIILGANPAISHMSLIAEPLAVKKLDAIHQRDGVVVVDPRRTETARRYEHLEIQPDGDVWLLGAMLNVIFSEDLADTELLRDKTTGWETLRAAVAPIDPEMASARCGVSAEVLRSLARRLAKAHSAACYGRVGTNRGRYSTLCNVFIEALNIVTGRFGTPGGWVIGISPVSDDNDSPSPFPPYGSERSRIGDLPLILGCTPGGTIADEITTPGEGQLRALFVDSGNPILSYPNSEATAQAFEQLDLLVALDLYVTETSKHADYILPATTFYERADLTDAWVANAPKPWVQYSDAVIEPCGAAKHEYEIYNLILERLGRPTAFHALSSDGRTSPSLMDAADTLLRSGCYGDKFGSRPEGLSIAKLREEFPSGFCPIDAVDAPASWRRIKTEDGKLRLWHAVTAAEVKRLLDDSLPISPDALKLFGRRKLRSMNSWMHNPDDLVRADRPTLLMHPDDARDRQIREGQTVLIARGDVKLTVVVEITDAVVAGSVNYPHGWGHSGGWNHANSLPGVNINLLASSRPEDWEQVSGMIHLDGIPVTVQAWSHQQA